jgi:hypothetical protein
LGLSIITILISCFCPRVKDKETRDKHTGNLK